MRFLLAIIIAWVIVVANAMAQLSPTSNPSVWVSGAMRNVMWKGQLDGTVLLDSIQEKQHLFGLGPVEKLAGEIMVVDGVCYTSRVTNGSSMEVTANCHVKAPFFVAARVHSWRVVELPDSVTDLTRLEQYLDEASKGLPVPFAFQLKGMVDTATIHVVNLPAGKTVSGPEDAHTGTILFGVKNESVTLVGFYSTMHQGIFTHHSTHLHTHLLNSSQSKMGHLENVRFKKQLVRLYLPM